METRCLISVFRQISKDLDGALKKKIKHERLPILANHIPLFFELPGTGESTSFNILAKSWNISKSSLSDMLKRYEQDGLVYREDSTTDGRVVQFGMTGKGIEVKEKLMAIEDDLLAELMLALNNDEKSALEQTLRKLI